MTHRTAAQALIVLATALTASGAALAQTATTDAAAAPAAAPAPNLTGNVSITTNYKFRGQDQDMIGRRAFPRKPWTALKAGLATIRQQAPLLIAS